MQSTPLSPESNYHLAAILSSFCLRRARRLQDPRPADFKIRTPEPPPNGPACHSAGRLPARNSASFDHAQQGPIMNNMGHGDAQSLMAACSGVNHTECACRGMHTKVPGAGCCSGQASLGRRAPDPHWEQGEPGSGLRAHSETALQRLPVLGCSTTGFACAAQTPLLGLASSAPPARVLGSAPVASLPLAHLARLAWPSPGVSLTQRHQ